MLAENGADVNAATELGVTSLQMTHIYGHSKCIELLLEHGADESSLQGLKFGRFSDQVCRIYSMKIDSKTLFHN